MLWDGMERVGMVAGQAEGTMDPEIPVGLGDKSPFDNQQLIEQTILDLTQTTTCYSRVVKDVIRHRVYNIVGKRVSRR